MQEFKLQFRKEETLFIKGFAIILMITLHCFSGKQWYNTTLLMNDNYSLIYFMKTLKICVGIYVFLLGYGYNFSKFKDFAYSLHHVKQLLTIYFIVLFFFTIPFCDFKINISTIILNIFGLDSNLSWVNWFIYFYIYSMIMLPLICRIINKRPCFYGGVLIICSYLIECVIHSFFLKDKNRLIMAIYNCFLYTPLLIFGYVFAKEKIFEKVTIKINKVKLLFVKSLFTIVIVFIFKYKISSLYGFHFDFIYVPIIVFCLLIIPNVYDVYKQKYNKKKAFAFFSILYNFMLCLGSYSVWMWFVHALFFTPCVRYLYQPLIMISKNLWIITIWTILLTYILSYILRAIKDY